MNLRMLWRRIMATRYTRTLEADVARLRAENRALLNSILGIAGVPPIHVTEPELMSADAAVGEAQAAAGTEQPEARASGVTGVIPVLALGADANGKGVGARPRKADGAQVATATRRRSWQQINRMLEFESAKKKPQEINS
jgi:hypothetical protein